MATASQTRLLGTKNTPVSLSYKEHDLPNRRLFRGRLRGYEDAIFFRDRETLCVVWTSEEKEQPFTLYATDIAKTDSVQGRFVTLGLEVTYL